MTSLITDDVIRAAILSFIMGEAYVTLLLQIGEGGTIDRYSRLILDKFAHEYRKYIRSYRVIERDANIDQVIESESGSGLHYKGIIPNVMIEVKTDVPDADTILNVIKSELFSRLHVRDMQYLKAY